MFQKGTGERFKYKEAVRKRFPSARCTKLNYNTSYTSLTGYIVRSTLEEMSGIKPTAEKAWEDAYFKYCFNK